MPIMKNIVILILSILVVVFLHNTIHYMNERDDLLEYNHFQNETIEDQERQIERLNGMADRNLDIPYSRLEY